MWRRPRRPAPPDAAPAGVPRFADTLRAHELDHIAWCVIGVYSGCERELRCAAMDAHGTTRLLLSADHAMRAGETAVLLPPDDIHEVSCLNDDAVSIHLYGRALEVEEPSMLQTYERSAVVTAALAAAHVSDV